MTASLTPRDRVVLMALMALSEEVSNAVLKERTGLTLEGGTRPRLNALGLVVSTKRGRSFWHELTDDGWAWCWKEMSQPAPARSDSGTRGLYTVLAALRGYLEHADLHLSDVFGFRAASSGEPLDARIRAAYWTSVAEPGDWVSLTQIRRLLGDAAKAEVDEALQRMEREPEVQIVPETAQFDLTPEDRAAAVRIGGKDKHLLKVERP